MLALLILVSISRFTAYFGPLAAIPLGKLLFGGAVLYAITQPSKISLDNIPKAWPAKLVLVLAFLACLSAPFGISLGASGMFMIQEYAKVVATFLLIVAAIRHAGDLRLFAWAYVLSCTFLVYISVFRGGMVSAGGMQRLGDLGIGHDANDLGLILTTGLPLAVALFIDSGKLGKLITGATLLGIGASLALSGSRGGLLGLIAVAITLLFFVRQLSFFRRVTILAAAGTTLFLFAPPGYWEQMETMTTPTEDYNWESPYGRRAIAERGMGYMLENPLTGVGVGNFGKAEGQSELARMRQQAGQGFLLVAPHNSYVQVGAELGIPGLIVFCMLVFGGIIGPWRLQRSLPDGWAEGRGDRQFLYAMMTYLPVSMVGYAVTTFFLSFAYIDVTYIVLALVAGLYVLVESPEKGTRRVRHGARRAQTASGQPTWA